MTKIVKKGLGMIFMATVGFLFLTSPGVKASEVDVYPEEPITMTEVTEITPEIEETLLNEGYNLNDIETVYSYTVDHPEPVKKVSRAYYTSVISAQFRKHNRQTGAAIGGFYNTRYKTLNVRNGYSHTGGYAVLYKNISSTQQILDWIRTYRTW